jgi:hypothetical protein
MDRRGVIVTTHSGVAIGMGSLRVSDVLGEFLRVDLHFETPSMRCVLGVPAVRLESLALTWDGAAYRYSLPSGDKVWMPQEDVGRSSAPSAPIIESFALPPPKQSAPTVANPLTKIVVPPSASLRKPAAGTSRSPRQ